LGNFLGVSLEKGPIAFPMTYMSKSGLDTGRRPLLWTSGPPTCYHPRVVPPLTPEDLALAALDPHDPEPGLYVRCPACDGPRLAIWVPGAFRCRTCGARSAFLSAPPGAPLQRVRCRRRCLNTAYHLEAGSAARAATLRCAICGEERPASFEVGRYGMIKGPTVRAYRVIG